jgi:FAD-dependent urate hydroxylase
MSKSFTPAVVIGAGPYGLSAAAHLRGHGVQTRVFGDVMSSWRHHMPVGMKLKSPPHGSDLSAPAPGFGLADFSRASGQAPLTGHGIIPIELFVAYGRWFQERWVPDLEPETVTRLEQAGGRFHLTLSSGEEFDTGAVVMAGGLNGYAHVPAELAAIAPDGPSPDGLVSHTSQHPDLSVFQGREVAVIGAGQSALESAALLHEAGAGVQVLVRGQARWGIPPKPPRQGIMKLVPEPNSPLGDTWRIYPFSHGPAAFPYLPTETRLKLVKRVLGPLGAWWLKDRVVGQVPVLDGTRVVSAQREGDKVQLTVGSAAGQQEMAVDHVLAATGYRVDLNRLDYLAPELAAQVQRVAPSGFPDLAPTFESSVPGLFFTSLTAAATFGPVMRFVAGAGFAARRVSAGVANRIA